MAVVRKVSGAAFRPEGTSGEFALPLKHVRGDVQLPKHLEFVRLDSRALDGNLLGDPSTRELGVLLPPSYFDAPERRYPVVYLLHGLGQKKNGHLGNTETKFPGQGGGNVYNVVASSPCPVLLIPRDGQPLRQVVIGYDGSPAAVNAAEALAKLTSATHLVVHAVLVDSGDVDPKVLDFLALRIERKLGARTAEQAYANQLRRRFPGSPEYQALQRGNFD